ncbi:MAG TPA: UDP-N-acetylmuramoyl-L-alanine--D-glutamate ligase [Ktedonobacteraceae bacterium]|nr:UDP-N-acetylmuramoyl-L-alanine--D-glutamate ligase [Ktedonobacteraceae bacterium]
MDMRGKRVLVMGLGLQGSGMGVARYAAQQGAKVRVTDKKSPEVLAPSVQALAGLPIEFILGEHRDEDFKWAEIVIRNPGVPRQSPYLQLAREHGARIEMESALFLLECPGKVIAVTGTRGKTTTTTLIYEILRASGASTVLGGNVAGVETISLLPQITPKTLVVLELSSWQLEGLATHRISPQVAVMTNIYPDHLDTYDDMEEYAAAKANIFRFQKASDLAIFNYDNIWTRRFGEESKAKTWYTSLTRAGSFERSATRVTPFTFKDTPMTGKHNLENILLATTTARLLGIPDAVIAATVKRFRGVAHRLEEVKEISGVRYINDSSSTTPIAGCVGVEAFEAPVVLVAGGNTKQLPLERWPEAIINHCRDVVLLEGTGTAELTEAIRVEAERQQKPNPIRGTYNNFQKAMDEAVKLTRPGDVLLFSPGYTSFGMFLNEFDRGDRFVDYVQKLKG